MKSVGRHVLVEYYGCDSEILGDFLVEFIFDTFVGATRYFPNGQKGGELSFLGEDDVFAGVVGLSKDYLDHVEKFDLAKCIEHLPSMRENLLFLYENSAIDLDKTTDWFN